MKKVLTIALVAGLSLAGAATAGDTCSGATSLLEGVTGGNLGGADSQWYSFAPGVSAEFAINTNYAGTDFIAAIGVFGSCGGPMLDGNQGSVDRNAFVRMALDGGQTYYIQVGRANNSSSGGASAFQLGVNVSEVPTGCPLDGDCFAANGTPGCDDTCGGPPCPGCCALICAIDPFCCTNSWDSVCQGDAFTQCTVVPVELQSIDVERR